MAAVRAFPGDFRLYLASSSPRRSQLLHSIGLPFEVVPTSGEETDVHKDPVRLAEENAARKARGAHLPADVSSGCFVLGADTVVVACGGVMGKPSTREEARAMIAGLEGRSHEVATGVALRRLSPGSAAQSAGPAVEHVGSTVTWVRFRPLNDVEIDAYLAAGEWHDKAGAYGIQGVAALLVDGIRGEYSNVVGLPLSLTFELFLAHGFDILTARWTGSGV